MTEKNEVTGEVIKPTPGYAGMFRWYDSDSTASILFGLRDCPDLGRCVIPSSTSGYAYSARFPFRNPTDAWEFIKRWNAGVPQETKDPAPAAPNVPEYDILHDSGIISLVQRVDRVLRDGWMPLGGVAVDHAGFYQALIRDRPS